MHRPDPATRYVMPTYLRNLRMLTPHDEEYMRVEYQLRASLRSLKVKILSVHAVNSPQQDAVFEHNNVGATVVDAWVDSRHLPEENSIHNIIQCGGRFRITDANHGALFSTGVIDTDDYDEQGRPRNESLHLEFLLCRVATGRSFVIERKNLGTHGIPSGYDSLAIHHDVPMQQQEAEGQQYFREYVINDESRVYPAFVVNCVFNPAEDRVKSVPVCEACEDATAVVYCVEEHAKLCARCDQQMHRGNRVQERHNRVPLNEMQSTVSMTMCKEHKSMPVQYYDPVSHVPVCIQCKMTGSHSSGELAMHQLVPITDAYQATLDDMDRERRTVEDRRQTIRTQLTSIERRMAAVNANHERCQEQLYEIVQRAVQLLHEETQSKLSALLSDEAELRRQLEFYEWTDSFLRYQEGFLNPVDFLQTYRSHSALLSQAPSEIVDGAAQVRPDLCVVGSLDIVVDDTNPAAMAATAAAGRSTSNANMQGGLNTRGSRVDDGDRAATAGRGGMPPQSAMREGPRYSRASGVVPGTQQRGPSTGGSARYGRF